MPDAESKTRWHRPRAERVRKDVFGSGENVRRADDFLGGMMRKLFLALVAGSSFVGCKWCESCSSCGSGASGHAQNVNAMPASPNGSALAGKAMQQGPAMTGPMQQAPQQVMPQNTGMPAQIGSRQSSMETMTR